MTDAVRVLEAAHDCFDAIKSCVRGTSVDFDSKVFGADAIDSNYYRLELKPPSSGLEIVCKHMKGMKCSKLGSKAIQSFTD